MATRVMAVPLVSESLPSPSFVVCQLKLLPGHVGRKAVTVKGFSCFEASCSASSSGLGTGVKTTLPFSRKWKGEMNRLKPFYTSFSRTPHLYAPPKWPPQVFLAFFSEGKTMELRRNRLLRWEELYYSIFYTSPECCLTAAQGSPLFSSY